MLNSFYCVPLTTPFLAWIHTLVLVVVANQGTTTSKSRSTPARLLRKCTSTRENYLYLYYIFLLLPYYYYL